VNPQLEMRRRLAEANAVPSPGYDDLLPEHAGLYRTLIALLVAEANAGCST
jgi:hypothetical protein